MSGLHEIKASIASVENTKKITRAMYLTAASKTRKARAQLESTRYYFNEIATTISEILAQTENADTPYMENGDKREGNGLYLILAADKGMAGGYNHNILNLLEANVPKDDSTLWVAGYMGRSLVSRAGYQVSDDFNYPVMNPGLYRAREIAERVVDAYNSGKFGRIYMVYTNMVTPLKLEPCIVQLLPLKPEDIAKSSPAVGKYEKAEFEPSLRAVFEHLVPHYLKGIIYGAFVNAFTSEQHARMYAMDNATSNADDMINHLFLRYNMKRQTQITQEINEIVSGIPSE